MILSVWSTTVAEAVAETEYTHMAETESKAETLGLVSAVIVVETEYFNLMQLSKLK